MKQRKRDRQGETVTRIYKRAVEIDVDQGNGEKSWCQCLRLALLRSSVGKTSTTRKAYCKAIRRYMSAEESGYTKEQIAFVCAPFNPVELGFVSAKSA